MDERLNNMNPTVDEYASQIDLHARKFAVQKATEAYVASPDRIDIIELSQAIHAFLTAK